MKQPVVSRDQEIMGGTPVFLGTRVPVQTLLDYLEAGDTIDNFLEDFSSVTRSQVIAFLEEAKNRVIESVSRKCCWTNARDALSYAVGVLIEEDVIDMEAREVAVARAAKRINAIARTAH